MVGRSERSIESILSGAGARPEEWGHLVVCGAPGTGSRLNPPSGRTATATTIGIDIGGTKVFIVRVTDGEVAAEVRTETAADAPLTPEIYAVIRELWSPDVVAVGAGVAGLVDADRGLFVWGPHVSGTGIPVRADLEEALGVPAVVDNDANMAAWGELKAGAGRGFSDMLLVTLGTGIGGAIVIDGEIHRGTGFAGEWGHMLFDPGGLPCDCGKLGCWETVASGPALSRIARNHVAQNPLGSLAVRLKDGQIDGEAVTAAADDGDESARGLTAQVGGAFGLGLCNLIAILDPEIIVVGGGLGSVGESLLGPARRVVTDALHGGSYRQHPPIVTAELGSKANAIGAALLASHTLGT
jgi:glucokinase